MIFWIIFILILCFGLVILIGAPYVPTLALQQKEALSLMGLKKGDVVLDIGSGDGRFLRQAAKQGYKAVGIEANPLLILISYIVCLKQRKNITIIWGNMWSVQWPEVQGIYVFLHTRFMQKLDTKIIQEYNGKKVNVVSYAFEIPNKKVIKKQGALYLYEYKG